jgi:GR25 family glycosyltransferase involved in LPS biosynthesis
MNGNDPESLRTAQLLLRKGLFREADEAIDSAVTGERADVSVKLFWLKIASLMGDHARALSRLETVKTSMPGAEFGEVEIDLLIQARSFAKAESACRAMAQRRGGISAAIQERIKLIETLSAIESCSSVGAGSGSEYVAYCINLDSQPQKWQRCECEGRQANISLNRISGLKGTSLPNAVVARLGDRVDPRKKGNLGCFVSHFNAWERFVETEHDTALIVEDDFRPRIRFPKSLDLLGIKTEFDICWLSERMATAKSGELTFNRVEDVAELRTANTSAGQRWHWAVGTEGYLVSRSGALKLLEYVNEDGFFGDVDARLLAYSLSPESKSRMSIHSLSRKLVDAHFQIIKQRKPILSLAASVGLIGLIDSGSDRKEQNSAG